MLIGNARLPFQFYEKIIRFHKLQSKNNCFAIFIMNNCTNCYTYKSHDARTNNIFESNLPKSGFLIASTT